VKKLFISRARNLAALILIVGILSGLNHFHVLSYCNSFATLSSSVVMYPFLKFQHYCVVPCKSIIAAWQSWKHQANILAQTQVERDDLLAENIALQASLSYQEQIAELVDFKKRYANYHSIIADIILKQFSDQHHFFLLDAGSRRGVALDMVVVYKNCLIGKITEVYPFYSKVILITDRSCKIAASCLRTKTQGIHEGKNTCAFTTLTFVSNLEAVQEQDLVLSSGEGLVFPKGFGLGRINYVELKDFKYTILLQPLIDFQALTHCSIILKGAEFETRI
jgi:rod shape-determining protein MreC